MGCATPFVSRKIIGMAATPCSRCKGAEPEPGQRYCAACQAAYMRDYRKTKRTREVREAMKLGHEQCRQRLIAVFRGIGDRYMNGFAAAEIIRQHDEPVDVARGT